ncbi:MAG: TlyA family RNA methyltransferase [Desulfofustis sp.]
MIRIDQLLVESGRCSSRKDAAGLIMSGSVLIDDVVVDKAGTLVSPRADIRIKNQPPFVSRAGHKLQAGLNHFNIDPSGSVCADIGASTGGFTDCLLQAGAKRVYAVDVAYGILDWKIRSDSRVITLERVNARNLSRSHIGEQIDLCVIDTSFISLTRVIPPVLPFFGTNEIKIVALIKPQFELSRAKIGSGGIVEDEESRIEAADKIIAFAEELGLRSNGYIKSPVRGAKGNQEYLLYASSSSKHPIFP